MKITDKIYSALVLLGVFTAGSVGAPREEWIALFDGTSLAEWHEYGTRGHPSWVIENGLLTTVPKGRDISSNRTFQDFELEFDWKISKGGNSGVMFRVDEVAFESGTRSGPEYQLLDNEGHRDGRNAVTSAGALYALYAPKQAATNPVGEWNHSRIIVKGAHVQFWLNGIAEVDAVVGSADWQKRISTSKFMNAPRYAKSPSGTIVLQDHGFPVWFRSIRIRTL